MQVQLSTTITQLWVTDGTPENTELVFSPTARPGQTFFSAWSPAGRGFLARLFNPATGFEPWYAQPPTFEPRLIKDFIPGPEPASDPASLVIAHPRDPLKALLIASTPETGTEFFVTDGSSAATSLLADLSPGANNSSIEGVSTDKTGGSTFFLNNTSQGVLLYQSDGTDVGTRALTNFSLGSTLGSFPGSATQVSDNLIVFIATLCDRVRHLMAYDLQSGAVSELTTSTAAVESVVGRVGSTVFLSVGDRTNGYELWKSDGTERGTALLKDIRSGGEDSRPARGVTLADNILFWANDGVHGAELFRSDGTVEGTKLVKDIFPGPLGSSTTAPIAVLGSKILFLRLMQVVKQVCGVVTERSRAQQRL